MECLSLKSARSSNRGNATCDVSSGAEIKFLSDHILRSSFPFPLPIIAGTMGRRAKNKQGDPLPLHADPDLNGSSETSKFKSKPGFKAKGSASNSNAKLGKRKFERDYEEERATKKPKGARSAGKPKPQVKAAPAKKPAAKAKGKPVKTKANLVEDEVPNDRSVGWGDVEDTDVQAEARCVPVGGSRSVAKFTIFLLAGHYSTTVTPQMRTARRKMLKSSPDLPGT